MPTITNYGDLVTTGNTTSQGTGSSTFAGSIGATVYQVAGTTVIDASRNLTNIGTVGSGAITSSSTVSGTTLTASTGFNASGTAVYQVAGTTVIDASRNLTNIGTVGSGAITSSSTVSGTTLSAGGFAIVAGGPTIGVTGNVYTSNAVQTTNVVASGNVTATQFLSAGGFALVAGGPRLGVTGNIYASNSLNTTNVYASNIADQTGSFGTVGQVLAKAAAGTLWSTNSTNPLSGTVTTSAVTYAATSSTIQTAPGIILTNPSASDSTVVLTCSGDVVAYSDRNIKTDIEPILDALSKVSRIGGYTFSRTDGGSERRTGVIAQEVREVLPEAVYETENGTLTVAYGNMVGLLIEAIKELRTEVAELKKQVKQMPVHLPKEPETAASLL